MQVLKDLAAKLLISLRGAVNATAQFAQCVKIDLNHFTIWIGRVHVCGGALIAVLVAKFGQNDRAITDIMVHVGCYEIQIAHTCFAGSLITSTVAPRSRRIAIVSAAAV